MATVISGCDITHAIATCGIVAPISFATFSTSAITFAARPRMYVAISPRRFEPHSVLSSGTSPGRYVPLSKPTPSGLYAITPTPVSRTIGNSSSSWVRFISE